MTFLIVLGTILLLLLLLLLCPLRLIIGFETEFSLRLRYLFLSFPILPAQKEELETPPTEEKEPEEKAGSSSGLNKFKKLLREKGLAGFLHALYEAVQLALTSSGKLLSRLKLRRFDLYVKVAGSEDAAQGAILYGQLSAGIYGACGLLFSKIPCKRKAVSVDLDYQAEANTVDFSAELSIMALYLLKEALALLIGAIPILRRFLRGKKGQRPANQGRKDFAKAKMGETK